MNLKSIILEYQEFLKDITVKRRDYQIEPKANYVITGVRRSGKTWFLFQIINEQFRGNYEKVLYVNFEDERFIDFKSSDFDLLLNAYYELYPEKKPVLFLDEMQNIDGWQKFCRRLSDQKYRVYVTGSNATMLSSDIASTLGGRFQKLEMNTLSFTEFIRFKGISFKKNDLYSGKINRIKNLFNEYFHFGGFPESLDFMDRRTYLHNIYTTVLYSDIVVRNKIRDIHGMRLLVKKIAESTNNELSYNRLKNLLSATGANVGTSTVISWVEGLKNAFLIRELKNLSYKFSEREAKKKYYFTDNGLLLALGEQSDSKLFETLVFNTLRVIHDEIWFFKSANAEVDFVIPQKILVQACYSLNKPSTKSREIKSLIKGSNFLKIDELVILTYDCEDEITFKGKMISVIPLWKYILKRIGIETDISKN